MEEPALLALSAACVMEQVGKFTNQAVWERPRPELIADFRFAEASNDGRLETRIYASAYSYFIDGVANLPSYRLFLLNFLASSVIDTSGFALAIHAALASIFEWNPAQALQCRLTGGMAALRRIFQNQIRRSAQSFLSFFYVAPTGARSIGDPRQYIPSKRHLEMARILKGGCSLLQVGTILWRFPDSRCSFRCRLYFLNFLEHITCRIFKSFLHKYEFLMCFEVKMKRHYAAWVTGTGMFPL